MIDKNDFKFKRAMKIRNAQTRLGAMHELCRGKKQCMFAEKEAVQAGFEQIEDGGATAAETSAAFADTGCGGYQPRYTKDGLGIQIEYHKDEASVNQSAGRFTATPMPTPTPAPTPAPTSAPTPTPTDIHVNLITFAFAIP